MTEKDDYLLNIFVSDIVISPLMKEKRSDGGIITISAILNQFKFYKKSDRKSVIPS